MVITSPSGRKYPWKKDRPFTQQEYDALVAYDASLPPEEKKSGLRQKLSKFNEGLKEYAKSEDQKNRELDDAVQVALAEKYPDAGIQPSAIQNETDIKTTADAYQKVLADSAKDVLPVVARVAAPLGAAMAIGTAPVSIPVSAGFMALGALFGEDLARRIEGNQPQTSKEMLQTGVLGATMAPLRVAPGAARALTGGALEGAAFATQGEGDLLTGEGAGGAALGAGIRLLENRFGFKAPKAPGPSSLSDIDEVNQFLRERAVSGINETVDTAGVATPFDEFRNAQSARQAQEEARFAYQSQMDQSQRLINQNAEESARILGSVRPIKSAEESFQLMEQELIKRKQLMEQELIKRKQLEKNFELAKTEQNVESIKEAIKRSQIGEDESIVFKDSDSAQRTKLDVNLGEGVGAVKERARLASRAALEQESMVVKEVEQLIADPKAKLSPQASRMVEQYGRANPAAMFAIARGGAGFAYGYSQGEDPVDKLGSGLAYALTGAVASPALARAGVNAFATKTKVGAWSLPEITLKPFMEALLGRGRNYEADLVFARVAQKQLETALGTFKNPQQKIEANGQVYEFLTGQRNISTLPALLADAALNVRYAIDELSDKMIDIGLATGELRNKIVDNMGAYLHRSYKIFTDPKWLPPKDVIKRWVDAHVDAAIDAQNQRGKAMRYVTDEGFDESSRRFFKPEETIRPDGSVQRTLVPKTRDELQQEYANQAVDLMDRKKASDFILGTASSGSSRDIFKKRQDLDALTRELLGEISDPLILISETVPRMAKSIATFQAEKRIVEIGTQLGLFTKTPTADPGAFTTLGREGDKLSPFSGYYTSPEIKYALDRVSKESVGGVARFWAGLVAASKFPKTVLSLKGHASNLWGTANDVFAQGHLTQLGDINAVKSALNTAAQTLRIANNAGRLDRNDSLKVFREMVREGLVNKSISGSDFLKGFDMAVGEKALGVVGKSVKAAGRVYMLPETMGKMINLAGEIKPLLSTGLTYDQAFKEAAKKVRATTADYDYLPKTARMLSLYGLLNPFFAYPADRFRVVYNTYKIGLEEIKSQYPAVRRRGASRLVAMTTTLGAAGVIGSNFHLEKDQEEAMRRKLPDRDSQGFLLFSQPDKDGNFSYQNLNYVFPHSVVMEAAASAMRGDNYSESAKNFVSALSRQMFGENTAIFPIIRALENRTETGKQIRSENDPRLKQIADTVGYLSNEMFMPLVAPEVNKFINLDIEETREGGPRYKLKDLILSNVAGIRTYRRNVSDATSLDARMLMVALGNDQRQFSSIKKASLVEEDRIAGYEQFEGRRKVVHDKLVQIVNDARTLNMSDDKIIRTLQEDASVPSSILVGAMSDIYLPTQYKKEPSTSEILEQWSLEGSNTKDAILKKLQGLAKTNPKLAQAVRNEYVQQAKEGFAGITPMQKLISGLDESDGTRAAFIMQEFMRIQGKSGRNAAIAYVDDLKKKRIVTPEVQQQLVQLINSQR
jgi:hypothetical protein